MAIIDLDSCTNVSTTTLVQKLQLLTTSHPQPYRLHWLNDKGFVYVSKQVSVPISLHNYYSDEVLYDVMPMNASHILLGCPWMFVWNNSLFYSWKRINLFLISLKAVGKIHRVESTYEGIFIVDSRCCGGRD